MRVTFNVNGLGHLSAVDGISFQARKGETLAIVGESGSGKSATAMSIVGLLDKSATVSGQILLNGVDTLKMSNVQLNKIRGKAVSFVFQDSLTALNPYLSVETQVIEPLIHHERYSEESAAREALLILGEVGFADPASVMASYPHQLSGGMRQRVAIAMALIAKPDLLIADEPTTSLDGPMRMQVLQMLDVFRKSRGMGVILISHDLEIVSKVADRILIMYAGKIVEEGPGAATLNRPSHPYTVALLESVPRGNFKDSVLKSIPGRPPRLDEVPSLRGCRFEPRCSFSGDDCLKFDNMFRKVHRDHFAACLRVKGEEP